MHPLHEEILHLVKTVVLNLGHGDPKLVMDTIGMIGSKINQIMEENIEGISLIELNQILFNAYISLQDLPNGLPHDEAHHEPYITCKALEYFILNNFVYTSIDGEQSITAFAYTLSLLLARMTSPSQLLPLENLHEFSDSRLHLAFRLYFGYSHVYHSALSKAIAIEQTDLVQWVRDYYATVPHIWSIIEELERRQNGLLDLLDKAVPSAITFISFSLMVMAISFEKDIGIFTEGSLLSQIHKWIEFIEKLAASFETDEFRYRINRIGIAYASFLVQITEAATKPEFPKNFQISRAYSIYREIKSLFAPINIFRTPYAPIATDLAVKGIALLSLESNLSSSDFSFIEELQWDALPSSFEIDLALVLFQLRFQEVFGSKFLRNLENLTGKMQNNPINRLIQSCLLAVLEPHYNVGDLFAFVNSKIPMMLPTVKDFVYNGGTSKRVAFNPFDPWTWLIPQLPNGRFWYPFNSISNSKVA